MTVNLTHTQMARTLYISAEYFKNSNDILVMPSWTESDKEGRVFKILSLYEKGLEGLKKKTDIKINSKSKQSLTEFKKELHNILITEYDYILLGIENQPPYYKINRTGTIEMVESYDIGGEE